MNTHQPPPVISLLGVPIHNVTMQAAEDRVRDAIRQRRRMFLTTPNLNFLIACQRDPVFRQSVIDSDLSIADGMPLILLSKLLGVPLPERVTGSGLFERLASTPPQGEAPPIRVFFFGGPPGVAEQACHRLNSTSAGMRCVGFESPGFGSVADMSQPELLARINASAADFLVVALGAAKGQAWIQRNRALLEAPVISHLGAVVNFAAGTVKRAPDWVQRMKLEWLWRIKEEPALWRRYWKDGTELLRHGLMHILPYALRLAWHKKSAPHAPLDIALERDTGHCRLILKGWINDPLPPALLETLDEAAQHLKAGPLPGMLELDLTQVTGAGPSFYGQVALLEKELVYAGILLRMTQAGGEDKPENAIEQANQAG